MAWVRIDDNVPHHRKMLKAGPDACWLWLCGIAYCQRQLSDGFIPECALTTLGVGTDLRRNEHPSVLVRRLIRVGLFEKVPGGFQVHDYHDHNETRANTLERKRLLSETRSAAGKAGAKSRWQTDGKPMATSDSKPMAPSHPIPSHPLPERTTTTTQPSPRAFDRQHAGHVFGFCAFKCLSEEKIQTFAKDLPGGADDPENFERVLVWATRLREEWGDKPKVEFEWFKFWEARWKERNGPVVPLTKGAQIVASGKAWAEKYDREHPQ